MTEGTTQKCQVHEVGVDNRGAKEKEMGNRKASVGSREIQRKRGRTERETEHVVGAYEPAQQKGNKRSKVQ